MTDTIRVAHGLFTWNDGRTPLEACLRSTAGFVDELIIADGLIDGVPANGLPWHSDLRWLAEAAWLPGRVPIATKQWRSLSAACTWILEQARRLECDWLLYVDGDQELHGARYLREYCDAHRGQVAAPIPRVDPGMVHSCPWQLVNVNKIRRYVAGCFVVETPDGGRLSLSPNHDTRCPMPDYGPWISHHPERRPSFRVLQRLGELETVLEPPPHDTACLQLPGEGVSSPVVSGIASEPTWICTACGRRYQAPGVCQVEHAPIELRPVADVEAGTTVESAGAAPNPAPAEPQPAVVDAPSTDPQGEIGGASTTAQPEPVPAADQAPPPPPPPPTAVAVADPGPPEPTPVERARDLIRQAFDILTTL